MFPLPRSFTPFAEEVFFALVGPCLPIVGNGACLLAFGFVAAILGGGIEGGTAREKGVFAGVEGGVGGRPTEGPTSL